MSPYNQTNLALVEQSAGDTASQPMISAIELAAALGLGTSLLIGRYRVGLASGDWWWSDEVYTMHGWKRHEVEPSLDALRSRKHPDDRARVLRAAGEALRTGRPFACAHRIVDKAGRSRSVVVIGQGQRGVSDGSPEVAGYVVDVTPAQKEAMNRRSKGLVDRAFVSQAVIEQAKGVISAVRGVDEGAAEQILRDVAGTVGVPLRSVADQVMAALRAEERPGVTKAALSRALDAVRPMGRPRAHDAMLTRRRRTDPV
ncbi:PAS and ANTAR domain-containing protein [Promicromonospora sp. Populi]|uniref:PAS and ANTAR domain-containing protein n=1 Tax=Promicromonospora sp. Populi TaxID=3239420 RepID=UPI0034E25F74